MEPRVDSCEEGYDYEFVPALNHKYECPICLSALREPHQTSCGHRFCKNCILKWIRESSGRCPVDNESISEKTVYPDNFAKREILTLSVKCPNQSYGCEVICELRDIKKHESSCEYVCAACPNNCGELVLKKKLTDHLQQSCRKRLLHCEHCSQRIEAVCIQAHTKECPMMKTQCKYCAASFTRCEIVQHLKEDCPMVTVPCLFARMGCKVEMRRNEIDSHMESCLQFHLKLTGEAVNYLFKQIIQNRSSSTFSGLGSSSINHSGSLEHLISDVQHLSVTDSGVVTTASSIQSENISSLASSFTPRDYTTKSCSPLSSVPESWMATNPPSAFPTAAIVTDYESMAGDNLVQSAPVLETLSRTQETLRSLQKQQCASCRHGTDELQTRLSKMEHTLEEERTVNKNLRDTIHDIEARTTGGTKIWPIHNYSRLRQEARNGQTTVLHSDGFYTSYYGYKICLRINLNGVDTAHGTHLSLFIHFMKGEFDDLLDWPFNGKIVLSILDQNESPEQRQHMTESLLSKPRLAAFQRPQSNRNHKGFGYMEFIPLSVIDSSTLVKNDTLIIKAVVSVNSGDN